MKCEQLVDALASQELRHALLSVRYTSYEDLLAEVRLIETRLKKNSGRGHRRPINNQDKGGGFFGMLQQCDTSASDVDSWSGSSIDEERVARIVGDTMRQVIKENQATAAEQARIYEAARASEQPSQEVQQQFHYVQYQEPHQWACFNCGQPGHFIRDCPHPRWSPPRVQYEERPIWTCFNCDQPGHFIRDCPQPRRATRQQQRRGSRTYVNSQGRIPAGGLASPASGDTRLPKPVPLMSLKIPAPNFAATQLSTKTGAPVTGVRMTSPPMTGSQPGPATAPRCTTTAPGVGQASPPPTTSNVPAKAHQVAYIQMPTKPPVPACPPVERLPTNVLTNFLYQNGNEVKMLLVSDEPWEDDDSQSSPSFHTASPGSTPSRGWGPVSDMEVSSEGPDDDIPNPNADLVTLAPMTTVMNPSYVRATTPQVMPATYLPSPGTMESERVPRKPTGDHVMDPRFSRPNDPFASVNNRVQRDMDAFRATGDIDGFSAVIGGCMIALTVQGVMNVLYLTNAAPGPPSRRRMSVTT